MYERTGVEQDIHTLAEHVLSLCDMMEEITVNMKKWTRIPDPEAKIPDIERMREQATDIRRRRS